MVSKNFLIIFLVLLFEQIFNFLMFKINFKALISNIHLVRLILFVSKQTYIRKFRKTVYK